MPNKNREKGKRWERKVESAIAEWDIPTDMVKDGYEDDYSDIILWHDFVTVQCKDVINRTWTKWFTELEEQRTTVGASYSVLSVKQKGKSAAETGLHLVPFGDLMRLLKAAKWADEQGYTNRC